MGGLVNRKAQKSAKALISRSRDVHMYAELWHASKCVLERGIENKKGSKWQFLSSIVLTAFALEAYMNHVGHALEKQNTLPICRQCFDRLPTLDKLRRICDALGVEFHEGERPFQTLQELKEFRDLMAHGKTETIEPKPRVKPAEQADVIFSKRLFADWEQKIKTQQFAERARADVEEALTKIHAARPDPKEGLFSFGIGFHCAKIIEASDQK